jgi:hypothetical protein
LLPLVHVCSAGLLLLLLLPDMHGWHQPHVEASHRVWDVQLGLVLLLLRLFLLLLIGVTC